MSEISGDLMSHLRYPEDLFKVQRMVLSRYHVTDADSFYGGQDFWRVPNDPTKEETATVFQPPYYLTLAMPGQEEPSFSLTTTFQPTGDREVLSGFLAVDADAGSEDGKRKEGYGKLRLLELPRDTTVKGPGQVENDVNSSNASSEAFSLTLNQFLNQSRQQGSRVTMGNLLTLPVGGGLLYVQPIYVSAKGTSAYPLSRATVVAFGDRLAWSDTLTGALDGLFGGSSGADGGRLRCGVTDHTDDTHHPEAADRVRRGGAGAGAEGHPGRLRRRPGGAQGRRLHGIRGSAEASRRRHPAGRGRGAAGRLGHRHAEPDGHSPRHPGADGDAVSRRRAGARGSRP